MSKILGVDHIVTSCKDIQIIAEKFNNSEYTTMFIEYGLQSTKEKKPYLKKFTINHDAIFLKYHTRGFLCLLHGSPHGIRA